MARPHHHSGLAECGACLAAGITQATVRRKDEIPRLCVLLQQAQQARPTRRWAYASDRETPSVPHVVIIGSIVKVRSADSDDTGTLGCPSQKLTPIAPSPQATKALSQKLAPRASPTPEAYA